MWSLHSPWVVTWASTPSSTLHVDLSSKSHGSSSRSSISAQAQARTDGACPRVEPDDATAVAPRQVSQTKGVAASHRGRESSVFVGLVGLAGLGWLAGLGGVTGLGLAGCADDGGPRLLAVTPSSAPRDAVVVITGRRLCGPGGDCARATGEIQLGIEAPMIRAHVVSYSDTAAEIAIPSIATVGATAVIVTVGERSSNALDFEVLP
jgi:hypothetical protein